MEWREKHQKSSTLIIREKFCQDIAIGLAKPCQAVGNSLVELLRLPLAQNNVDDDRRTDNGRDGIQGDNTRFAGHDANQVAKQCHCTATQDGDRQ